MYRWLTVMYVVRKHDRRLCHRVPLCQIVRWVYYFFMHRMTAFFTTLMNTFMIIIIVRGVIMTEYFTNLIILLL